MREEDLWEEMNNMKRQMDRLFSRMRGLSPMVRTPSRERDVQDYRDTWVDMRENNDEYIIAIELPGVNKEDIEVNLTGNFLEIKAQKKQEKKKEDREKGIYGFARSYAGFYKAIDLPPNADTKSIDANYKEGILKIKVPKKEKTKSKNRIEIH